MAGGRVDGVEHALRLNAATELAAGGVEPSQAARVLAVRFGVSVRQARRYVDQAAASGPVEVPDRHVVFTVKLPAGLAERVRAHARESDTTISALVTRALIEFLSRGRRERPRR
jgi:hypothetical protein